MLRSVLRNLFLASSVEDSGRERAMIRNDGWLSNRSPSGRFMKPSLRSLESESKLKKCAITIYQFTRYLPDAHCTGLVDYQCASTLSIPSRTQIAPERAASINGESRHALRVLELLPGVVTRTCSISLAVISCGTNIRIMCSSRAGD